MPTEGIDKALIRVARVATNTPETFERFGATIVYTPDGMVDARGTFLSAAQRLKSYTDAAEQAYAGAMMFGKGWLAVLGA